MQLLWWSAIKLDTWNPVRVSLSEMNNISERHLLFCWWNKQLWKYIFNEDDENLLNEIYELIKYMSSDVGMS